MRLVFCFLTGNSDMHLKNFSLIETEVGSSQYVLSPAYDLLPVQLILPGDIDDTALIMNGKNQKLHRKDFLIFAETAGIPQKLLLRSWSACLPMSQSYKRCVKKLFCLKACNES